MKSIKEHFTDFQKTFADMAFIDLQKVMKNVLEFQSSTLVELQMKSSRLKTDLESIRSTRDQFQKKKEVYFGNIQASKIENLIRLKNKRANNDKSKFIRFFSIT
jgi:hypothetical protein